MNQKTLRLVVSNPVQQNLLTHCEPSRQPPSPPSETISPFETILENLLELDYIKPAHVGGLDVLLRDMVRDARKQHPTLAAKWAAQRLNSGDFPDDRARVRPTA